MTKAAVPVAVKVTVGSPVEVAVSVFVPGVVLSFQFPADANPFWLANACAAVTVPLPLGAKLTTTPAAGFPSTSVMRTAGLVSTMAPALAV